MNEYFAIGSSGLRGRAGGILYAVLAVAWALAPLRAAQAAIFNVNSAADVVDATPGDGVCETGAGNHVCTLRAAILEANELTGMDTINLQANTTYLLTRAGDGPPNGSLDLIDSVAIVGAGPASTIIDGNGAITNARVFEIHRCIRDQFSPEGCAVGFVEAGIAAVTIQHGLAAVCAGIYNYGRLTLTNSAIRDNIASLGGGFCNTREAKIVGSTFNNNVADSSGGGIYNNTSSTLNILNSTISQNATSTDGGGIYNAGQLGLFNVTIADNIANADHTGGGLGGGVYNPFGATLNMANSILTRNVTQTEGVFSIPSDCSGQLNSQGFNIVSFAQNCTVLGSYSATQPLLGPLQDNGGPTMTHALLSGNTDPGNPIDGGNPSGCTDEVGAPLTTDQRGQTRPAGEACDIGAYEAQPDSIFLDGFEVL